MATWQPSEADLSEVRKWFPTEDEQTQVVEAFSTLLIDGQQQVDAASLQFTYHARFGYQFSDQDCQAMIHEFSEGQRQVSFVQFAQRLHKTQKGEGEEQGSAAGAFGVYFDMAATNGQSDAAACIRSLDPTMVGEEVEDMAEFAQSLSVKDPGMMGFTGEPSRLPPR